MNRLTEKDDQGNWHLKGVRWEQLHEGQVITGELREKLYGALWKLMEYEDTGLSPEEVENLKEKCSLLGRKDAADLDPTQENTSCSWQGQMASTFLGELKWHWVDQLILQSTMIHRQSACTKSTIRTRCI